MLLKLTYALNITINKDHFEILNGKLEDRFVCTWMSECSQRYHMGGKLSRGVLVRLDVKLTETENMLDHSPGLNKNVCGC